MALDDVPIPDPPTLHGPQDPGDYEAVDELEDANGDQHRRDDLAAFLQDGAWETAFDEWAAHTDVTAAQFDIVRDRGLVDEFDFYWNPPAEDVGYRAPSLSDHRAPDEDDQLERDDIETIDAGLDDLGRTVSEVLENDYIHRDDEEWGYSWEQDGD